MPNPRTSRSVFGPVGHFMRETFRLFEIVHQANTIVGMREESFRARGTTRDKVLRDLISKI